jgi:plastocyanin
MATCSVLLDPVGWQTGSGEALARFSGGPVLEEVGTVLRTLTILVLAAVAAVPAAGCAGAGGDDGTTAAGPATTAASTGGSARAGGGRDAYGSRSEPTSSRASGPGDVRIADFAFSPRTITAKVGQRVRWENQDVGVTHTVTADGGGFRSGRLEEGAGFSHLFQTAGTHAYRCAIHGDMRGTVEVIG